MAMGCVLKNKDAKHALDPNVATGHPMWHVPVVKFAASYLPLITADYFGAQRPQFIEGDSV